MTNPCAVSVVIPCFNHGEFLSEAVASVTDTRRPDAELIVVDDGSSDERTGKEMAALVEKGIQVIRQSNQGLAAARNAGIAAASGRYILPLDADNRLRPAYIERGIGILDSRPDVGVVYGDAQYIGLRNGRWNVGAFNLDQLLQCNYIDACALFRRSVWEQNGGYDRSMLRGEEDWDFWLGAVEKGWEFAYVPEVLFDYRIHAESMITRARPFKPQIDEFVARKHAMLYRRRSVELGRERSSIRATSRNLYRLLTRNLRQWVSQRG